MKIDSTVNTVPTAKKHVDNTLHMPIIESPEVQIPVISTPRPPSITLLSIQSSYKDAQTPPCKTDIILVAQQPLTDRLRKNFNSPPQVSTNTSNNQQPMNDSKNKNSTYLSHISSTNPDELF